MKEMILKNRYTLLLATLVIYMGALVAEGMITGREARVLEFENPYFDFNVNEFEQFRERRNGNDRGRDRNTDTGDV